MGANIARPNCEHSLDADGHDPAPMVKNGRRGGRQEWVCQLLKLRRGERYDGSPKGRARHRTYDGSRAGVDRVNRRYYRTVSANIEANQTEIAAIQKRIRDAN